MTKFFVGQRVVLVRGLDLVSRAKNFGIQGRILRFADWPRGTVCANGNVTRIDCDTEVRWDGNGGGNAQNTLQLEPILPEGSAPSEYSFSELMDSLRETVK